LANIFVGTKKKSGKKKSRSPHIGSHSPSSSKKKKRGFGAEFYQWPIDEEKGKRNPGMKRRKSGPT